MFRIRRLHDLNTATDRHLMAGVKSIFGKAFDYYPEGAEKLERAFLTPRTKQREYLLLVAEDGRHRALGFAFIHDFPDLRAAYLDWIASDPAKSARGVGGALYEAARELLADRRSLGLFLDVPPDDRSKLREPRRLEVNRRRLAFYERFGARPIEGTLYDEVTSRAKEGHQTFLVYDPLGRRGSLRRAPARKVVARILTSKYGMASDDPHVRRVVASFRDDPVRLRERAYGAAEPAVPADAGPGSRRLRPLQIVVGQRHEIHHLTEKGYVERPVRMRAVLRGLEGLPVEERRLRRFGMKHILAVHDRHMVEYIRVMSEQLRDRDLVYPNVFPIRHPDRRPRIPDMRAGYFCIDTFTPLTNKVYLAAKAASDAALSAAQLIREGERLAYALIRPPGHHAERRVYGGFCYFNNASIAARFLAQDGKVALLDIDHHHGNGSQDIFYESADVLTLSIHGNPRDAYPYFSGYADERGAGPGLGYNRNYPLRPGTDDARYLAALDDALGAIRRFRPAFLVLSLGFDIMRGDPTGTFEVTTRGMRRIGERIGGLGLPTLVVQEGGYSTWNLRRGGRAFFDGIILAMT